MADSDFTFTRKPETRGGFLKRRDSLGDQLNRALYQVVERKTLRPDIFAMDDAWEFFRQMRVHVQEGTKCMLSVKEERGRYKVTQILLNAQDEPIPQTTKAYWGRTVEARQLDESVVKYLGDGTARIMKMPEL